MSRIIMLVPTRTNVALNSVILGIIHAIKRKNKNTRIGLFKPIEGFPLERENINKTTTLFQKKFNLLNNDLLKMSHVESLLSSNQKNILMEKIADNFYKNSKNTDIILLYGLILTYKHQFTQLLNYEIAKMLDAEIVFVISQDADTPHQIKERIQLIQSCFNGMKNTNIIGVIINKVDEPINREHPIFLNSPKIFYDCHKTKIIKTDLTQITEKSPLPILGIIPWNVDLIATRVIDIVYYLNATVINVGNMSTRRVKSFVFCENKTPNILECLQEDSLLVISVDYPETLITVCLAIMSGVKISAILLTGGYKIDEHIRKVCEHTFTTGLPVFIVNSNTLQTFLQLQKFDLKLVLEDYEHIRKIQEYIANHINDEWIRSLDRPSKRIHRYFSPDNFRYHLIELARKTEKRIILPEGEEPRIIKAAAICAKRGIAVCVLLGDLNKINHIAESYNIKLSTNIKIIDPKTIRENYINRLVELRNKKGMTEILAKKQLEDNIVLGTMMLEQNEVDGLVSGTIHTTANTIRPSLQLIKTSKRNSLVSSVFFMLLPEKVYIYGDCAINQNPTIEQLSEIAIQSADSAATFGIDPYVAMLSYSTGSSGEGRDVEKVREATRLAKEKRPDLIIDGPLQYDAAVMVDVAKLKAPNSPVAGRATVFIFPDLNAGNITYKAVQRSANLISIGPMLQGMKKPVNDLSRGALIDDIVYTIALTVIQATKQ